MTTLDETYRAWMAALAKLDAAILLKMDAEKKVREALKEVQDTHDAYEKEMSKLIQSFLR